ncbi:SRPBCC family protein [Pseudoruegeria sp. SHC-113]|uniref:SRPBCC family protein n=1 Tax=Pseudoruegeria sp. SHC-113 TaxID=2855439 RepID=UPI0021BAD79C|nr:SRPBCC family protein [Pseudoruegeria sp. SHC-113]MCT8161525.1 SRPBCC family protein [Pseudoruegeria sp. SHC-113]
MKLSANEDIEAPIDAVFRAVTDFDFFERTALRRGVEVSRTEGTMPHWKLGFEYRGKARTLEADLLELQAPSTVKFRGKMGGIFGDLDVELVPLSKNRTRLSVATDLKAQSLTGKLLLQSLKLAKTKITKRYKKRVGSFAADVEKRLGGGAMHSA